ncbi:GNAT family N-acetyltransferase [Tomitella biformata]|uniref:GNAT family N-acetyltransferase n=1 Tax=Tomitella biformata TaxID=630403 RepID=UPI0004641A4E|nr:GNAT family N-acetyltransferase [Tomitella biformata]
MLKLLGARPVGPWELTAVLRGLDTDPIATCMVAARVQRHGLSPTAIRGELWSRGAVGRSLCFSGGNLVPLWGKREDLHTFADRALRHPRRCSAIVGRTELAIPLWEQLASEWGPPREVRPEQPLLALSGPPRIEPDLRVRQVRAAELEPYLAAATAMFIEEVGVDPRAHDGGAAYRDRIRGIIASGAAWARFEDGEVVFKAEIGAQSDQVSQINGVWVSPQLRGGGLGTAGTATIAQAIQREGRVPSLYVNAYNHAARRSYEKIGFTQVATFSTILID